MRLEAYAEQSLNSNLSIYQIVPEGTNGDDIHDNLARKLIGRDELADLGEFYRRRRMRTGFVTGTYDMIHVGHARFLGLLRDPRVAAVDVTFVGLNSDASVKSYKGPGRPILGEQRRAEMLAYLAAIEHIVLYDEPTGDALIRLLKPDALLLVEGSWPSDTSLLEKEEVKAMAEHGGKIYVSPRQEPKLSTSTIVERLEAIGRHDTLQRMQEMIGSLSPNLDKSGSL